MLGHRAIAEAALASYRTISAPTITQAIVSRSRIGVWAQ